MARINLLPWRAERRRVRQKEFMAMLGASAVAAAVVSFLIWMFYNGLISGEKERNDFLREQMAWRESLDDAGSREEVDAVARELADARRLAYERLAPTVA